MLRRLQRRILNQLFKLQKGPVVLWREAGDTEKVKKGMQIEEKGTILNFLKISRI